MNFRALKLLWVLGAVSNSYQESARCVIHQLEDIEQKSLFTNVEKINFNEIIKALIQLVTTTEKSKFTRLTENFILGKGNICQESAKGITLEQAKWLQKQGFTTPIFLALKYVDSGLLTYDHQSKSALLLEKDETALLLANYNIENIEEGVNNDLFLEDNKIKTFDVNNEYICQASTLLLQNGLQRNQLVNDIYYKIKQIFQINNILVDIIEKDLHQCCSITSDSPISESCLFLEWTSEIKKCFRDWSNILKRKVRNPGAGELLSWAFGEGEQIGQVSSTVDKAISEYNVNFKNMNQHELKLDYNINSLTKIQENITRYEKALYTNNLISSVLSQQNFKRLFNSLKMSNNLKELSSILSNAGIEELITNLSNALLKINPACVIEDNHCITFRYLTQAASKDSVLLHEVSSELVRTISVILTCLPQLGKVNWQISDLNKQKFSLENNTLTSENRVIQIEQLSNATYLNYTMRDLKNTDTTLRDFLIFSLEMAGEEKFKLFCLNSTLFHLNGEHRKCSQNEILSLPSSNWVLKNGFGTFSHFNHNFHLKELHQTNNTWKDITDSLMTPQLEINEQKFQSDGAENEISWITDEEGNISNESHYTFYTLMGGAIFIIFLVVCFHSEIRKCCDCLTPRRKFLPEITYKKDPEQVVISQEAMTLAERSFKNRDKLEGESLPNIPEIVVKKKAVCTDNIPTGRASAGTCAPNKAKTTNIEICDLASAETRKIGSVRFLFPKAKGQEK